MTATKEQLGALIEAYAAARATGNNILIQSSGSSLVQFLDTCEITKPEADPVAITNDTPPEADG